MTQRETTAPQAKRLSEEGLEPDVLAAYRELAFAFGGSRRERELFLHFEAAAAAQEEQVRDSEYVRETLEIAVAIIRTWRRNAAEFCAKPADKATGYTGEYITREGFFARATQSPSRPHHGRDRCSALAFLCS